MWVPQKEKFTSQIKKNYRGSLHKRSSHDSDTWAALLSKQQFNTQACENRYHESFKTEDTYSKHRLVVPLSDPVTFSFC